MSSAESIQDGPQLTVPIHRPMLEPPRQRARTKRPGDRPRLAPLDLLEGDDVAAGIDQVARDRVDVCPMTSEATDEANGDAPEEGEGTDESASGGTGDFCTDYIAFNSDWGYSDIRDRPDEYASALGELEVPDEIAGDVQTVVDNAEVLGASAGDIDPSQAEDFQATVSEVQDATSAITDYVKNNCDVIG